MTSTTSPTGDLGSLDFCVRTPTSDERLLRQKVKQVFDGSPPAANGQPFQYLGDEDEQHNDQGGEELADRQGRTEGDGHGQFHRHAPGEEVGDRLLEDRIAADQSRHECDHVEADEMLPETQPTGEAGQCHEADPHQIDPLQGVFVALVPLGRGVPGHVPRREDGSWGRPLGLEPWHSGSWCNLLWPVYFRYAFSTSINS